MKLYILLVLIVFTVPTWAQKANYFPPRGTWETKAPQEVEADADKIAESVEFAKNNYNTNTKDLRRDILEGFQREPYHELLGPVKKRGDAAGMIIKDGYVIAQWGDTKRVDMTFSVTKSYLSTVAGLALQEGLIGSLKDKVSEYVWDRKFEGKHNAKINWEHLLTQSSDWSGELWGGKDWADRPPSEGDIVDWERRALREPGTFFEYNDVRVNLLAYSLLQVWRKPLPQVIKEKIMDPIGASTTWRWFGYENSWVNVDGAWVQSVSGGGHSGGGLFINTEDHARFGLLFLNEGRWQGKQLFPNEWVEMATSPSVANENYGFMWWLNPNGENNAMPELSPNAYYAAGFGGNYIIVEPDHNLVIVVRWFERSKINDFLKVVKEAVK